jgi:hypothetical protein
MTVTDSFSLQSHSSGKALFYFINSIEAHLRSFEHLQRTHLLSSVMSLHYSLVAFTLLSLLQSLYRLSRVLTGHII